MWVALTSREMPKEASLGASDSLTEGFPGDAECISNLLIAETFPVYPGALWEKYWTSAFLMSMMSHNCNQSPLWFDLDVLFPCFELLPPLELAPDWGLGGLRCLLGVMLVACNTQ